MKNTIKFLLTLKMLFWDPKQLLEGQDNYYSGFRFTSIILGTVILVFVLAPLISPDINPEYAPQMPKFIQAVFDGAGEFYETFGPLLMIITYWTCLLVPIALAYYGESWKYISSVTFFSLTMVVIVQQLTFPILPFWIVNWILPFICILYFILRTLRKRKVLGVIYLLVLYFPIAYCYYAIQNTVLPRLYPMMVLGSQFKFDYPETNLVKAEEIFLEGKNFSGNISWTFLTPTRTFADVWNSEKQSFYLYDLEKNGNKVLEEPLSILFEAVSSPDGDGWKFINRLDSIEIEIVGVDSTYSRVERDTLKLEFFELIRSTFQTGQEHVVGLLGSKMMDNARFPATAFYDLQDRTTGKRLVWDDLALENQSVRGLYYLSDRYVLITDTDSSIKVAITDSLGKVSFIKTIFEEGAFQEIGFLKTAKIDEARVVVAFPFPDDHQNKIFAAQINVMEEKIEWTNSYAIPNDYIQNHVIDLAYHNGKLYFCATSVFTLNYSLLRSGPVPMVFSVDASGEIETLKYFHIHEGSFFKTSENFEVGSFLKEEDELKVCFRHTENWGTPFLHKDETFFYTIDF